MNSISTSLAAPSLWARSQTLAPAAKLVLWAKSLIGQAAISKTAFIDCLCRSQAKAPDGRAWSYQAVNAALTMLAQAGLLDKDQTCAVELLHPLAMEAVDTDAGRAIAAALLRGFPVAGFYGGSSSHFAVPAGLAVHLRVAIYLNDPATFLQAHGQCVGMATRPGADGMMLAVFAGVKLDPRWLATRLPPIRLQLLESAFSGVRHGARDDRLDGIISAFRGYLGKAAVGATVPLFLRYDFWQARLDDVVLGLDRLGDPSGILRLEFLGALAFLEADFSGAIKQYREALKLRRKVAGKRQAFFEDEHAVFFLLAMLGARDATLHTEVQFCIDTVLAKPFVHASGLMAINALLWLVQGFEAKARAAIERLCKTVTDDPLSAACALLAVQALDPDLLSRKSALLAERFVAYRHTLPLMARIFAELRLAAGAEPAPLLAFLDETSAHIKLRFCELVQADPPWARALATLDAHLFPNKPIKQEPAQKTKRLVWFIDVANQIVQPVEQVARGNDSFSDGRPLALKRLHDRDARLDYLTEQDRAAVKGLHRFGSSYYGDEGYAFDPLQTIPALVGHPLVFDARKRNLALELMAGTPELVVSEAHGMLHVSLSHASEEPALFLEAETPTRYRVTAFAQNLLPVQEVLGRNGLHVPPAGRDRLLELLTRGQPSLPIRTEIEGFGPAAEPGLAMPVVQMLPIGDSVKIGLMVRLFGADGPAYVGGLGNRTVSAMVAGASRRVTRDLPREISLREALLKACPSLRDRIAAEGHEAMIDDLETQLEFLLELQIYQAGGAERVSIEWPDGKRVKVRGIGAEKLKLRVAQDRDWFSVEGELAVDDDRVLEMRYLLDRLGNAHGRFVQLDDGSFVALTRHLQQQLGRLAAVSEPHKKGRRVHALGAAALRDLLNDAGEVKQDSAWRKHFAKIRAAEKNSPAVPPALRAELRDYQLDGFAWMARLAAWGAGACLADDMGLGKTVQAIALMLLRADTGPCLVVAPTSVCGNWISEMSRFAPTLKTHRLSSAADRAALIESLGPHDVLVCSYGLLHAEQAALGDKSWGSVVLDEAQAIKNAGTKRARASLELQAGFRLALTGTPVENDLDELWSLFSFVCPGLLGSREGFAKRFAVPIERDHDPQARAALRALVRPFLLRRTKAAVLSELPSRTEQTLVVEMGDAERSFYEALRRRSLERLAAPDPAAGGRKIRILAEITKLRRACCNPALIDAAAGVPSGKLEALMELVEELILNHHRALIFSQFTSHLALVRTALEARGFSYEYLDGSTPAAERERRVNAFQSGSAPLFLISLKAGGTGLNLTAADYVIHLDPWWNPAVEDQASDRAHRLGQERPVTIYRLIMQGSIEERILELHRDKRDLAADLLDGAEASARLSEAALLDLIRG